MLLVLVEMERVLYFLTKSLVVGIMAVATVFLFVDIASTTTLQTISNYPLLLDAYLLTPVWNSSWGSRALISGTKSTERRPVSSDCGPKCGDFAILPAPPRPVENSPVVDSPSGPSRTMPPSV